VKTTLGLMADDLNPAQRDAVETLSGPLLVLAGAGSGKTRVVTYRVANLIRHKTRPERILAVTFTRRAAGEMQERAIALLGRGAKLRPEISTFHSLCLRVLRRHARRLGYPESFAIYDRGEQESLARQVLREIRAPESSLRPGDLLALVSRWKTCCIRPEEAATVARSDKEHLAAVAYRRYQKALVTAGAADFDDLLLLTEQLLSTYGDVRREEAGRFDHLLIDEYQDTNASQYRIVRFLAAGHRNLCVVGDDDQSIYGWRGAEVSHILRFRHDWPEAKIVRLEENYRSSAEILALANRLIAFNKLRHEKTLRAMRRGGPKPQIVQYPDETAEADAVIDDIRKRLAEPTVQPRDLAILFRTNEQPRAFEAALRKAKLPYNLVGGMSFYDRREVRDVLAYLKLLASPQDETSLRRIINTPARGIGASTVVTLVAAAVERGVPLWKIICDAPLVQAAVPAGATAISRFRVLIERFAERAAKSSLAEMARELIQAIDYKAELARQYPEERDQEARWNAVEELVNALAAYEKNTAKPTLTGFIDDVTVNPNDQRDDREEQLARNAIALMTLHSAKGLEFPEVYLVGLEEGLLPHHRSLADNEATVDEERRLCYVGITRAQYRLTMTMALTRMKWGRPRDTQPSRFLFEITGQAESAAPSAPPPKRNQRVRQ
jgi:DNA helicase II / ATP-dependent DNA helicase PcrA